MIHLPRYFSNYYICQMQKHEFVRVNLSSYTAFHFAILPTVLFILLRYTKLLIHVKDHFSITRYTYCHWRSVWYPFHVICLVWIHPHTLIHLARSWHLYLPYYWLWTHPHKVYLSLQNNTCLTHEIIHLRNLPRNIHLRTQTDLCQISCHLKSHQCIWFYWNSMILFHIHVASLRAILLHTYFHLCLRRHHSHWLYHWSILLGKYHHLHASFDLSH